MDIFTHLILIKNNATNQFEDKTSEISSLKYVNNLVQLTYIYSNRTYKYSLSKVKRFREPKKVDLNQRILLVSGFPIRRSSLVLDFGEYIKIIDENQRAENYHKSMITYQNSCLSSKQPRAVFDYFKKLSSHVSVMEDGRAVLFDQYEKITRISEDSVLATYISGSAIHENINEDIPIFPFGLNLSQEKAVKAALGNSISIIEGPPGTGKTQTILNIIANVAAKGKTIGVVSGNNSATSNVQEKFFKNGYGFITALLGNSNKKTDFFEHKQSEIPDIAEWAVEAEKMETLNEELISISKDLEQLLEDKNKIAKLKEKFSKLEVEQGYSNENFKDTYVQASKFSFYKKWSSDLLLDFITYYESIVLTNRDRNFSTKTLLLIKYGIYKFKFVNENQNSIISSLKRDYYKIAIEEIEQQIAALERRLENKSFSKLMEQYTDISARIFKGVLHIKYSKEARRKYTVKSFRYCFENFIEDYPVVLSTTHSIMNSISENFLFDYLIIDEASQVDLVTASLALACCKNVVIVGDVKQLHQIVGNDIEKISDELFYASNIGKAYNYNKYSIIASLMNLYKEELPKTLLSEHYRCHPKIIGFCNEKFYDGKLVIMTDEKTNDTPLKIYKTAPGNHARKGNFDKEKGWFNIRQIEVIRDEIISADKDKYGDCSEVGIICPYRKQVTEINKYIYKPAIEVDTVHKFQGREKSTIIFTTVVNDLNSFVDDANLINVAVSRAVNDLIVVTSHKLFKQHGTNIGDLIRYIEYNSPKEVAIESQKVSVFDLLYSEYSDKLLKIMNSIKYVSDYESENLMYKVIEDVLKSNEFECFRCVLHVPLSSIVRDFSMLNEEEIKFAQNPWTHVDFLIFNKLDKEPVLVVEVDGFEYHMNNKEQQRRDVLKDKILKQINLPILRVATNESGEKEKLIKMLNRVVKLSGEIDENDEIFNGNTNIKEKN
jgi:superfamily I DNA and/or RNA helicase/very-short-patch-repair endonuclease